MSQLLVGCPLCCQATFSSTNALCIALITVASKSLKCPLCEDVLCGLDKLTIHLLSHLLVQPSDQLANQINTESNHSLTKQKLQETERDEITVTNLKLVDEQHKCFETITTKFDKIEKPFDYSTDDENIMRPPFLDNHQTQRIIVDDEVMLVFDKSKMQDGIPECSSKKFNFTSVNTETHLKNIVDDSHQNVHGLPSLNNLQSVKDNYDSEIYFKTDHIPQSSVDIVVSELNNNNLSEYSIKNKKSQIKDAIVFKETTINGLDQINFGNQVDVIDCSLKMSDNLAESVLSADKTKINLCKEPSNQNDKSFSLCSGLVNDLNLGSNSSSLVGLECGECPITFSDLKMLSVHQQLVHSNQNCEERKKVYSCKLCTKSFKMKGSLIVHTKVAHSAGPTALSKLLEATKKNEPLCVNNDVIPFSCSVCGKGFKKEQHLVQHEKIHEGKQWECDVCGKTFTTKYFLKKHHLLHTGEMPYTCATCNKSFTFQQSYHKHLLYHSDDKPYQCTECGRSFKELSTLHNHQRIHTGEKPYSCETCGLTGVSHINTLISAQIQYLYCIAWQVFPSESVVFGTSTYSYR